MNTKTIRRISFFNDTKSCSFPEKILIETARKLIRNEKKLKKSFVNVILCSDYKIRKLNKAYRKIDRPTDVLSFPFNEEDFLGEIYISLQRAEIQARQYGTSYDEEVRRLFVHGIIHLLGFDHKTEKDRRVMETREKRYC